MKNLILLASMIVCISCAQTSTKKAPTNATASAYDFPAPKGWQTETFPLPIAFAPTINYKGKEDIRFMPGFEHISKPDYWSYVFAWWLEDKPDITVEKVDENLTAYYRGLVLSNIKDLNQASRDSIQADMKEVETLEGDEKTFSGIVNMIDYMEFNKPAIVFHVSVHVRNCGTHTAVIHEVSPAQEGNVREQLRNVANSFVCK